MQGLTKALGGCSHHPVGWGAEQAMLKEHYGSVLSISEKCVRSCIFVSLKCTLWIKRISLSAFKKNVTVRMFFWMYACALWYVGFLLENFFSDWNYVGWKNIENFRQRKWFKTWKTLNFLAVGKGQNKGIYLAILWQKYQNA